jgi:hypothetical protein
LRSHEAEISFNKAFISCDLDNMDEFDALMDMTLGEMFPVTNNFCEPAIAIKDDAYNFSVDPDIIKMVEDNKFYGKDEEFPTEHLGKLVELATVFGKDEIQQHYYFLKLFPFSLGGDAKAWYNSLAPRSITSKDECLLLFYEKYFPANKIFAKIVEINNFSQKEKESLPQSWGEIL